MRYILYLWAKSLCCFYRQRELSKENVRMPDPCPVGKEDKHLASAITEQLIMVKIVTTQQEPVQQNVTE